jgi:hypothetical protein
MKPTKVKSVFRQPKESVDPIDEQIGKGIPKSVPRTRSGSPTDVDSVYAQKKRRLDPLTEKLGQKSYLSKARFEWLKRDWYGKLYALEVDRYYEGLNLCLDLNLDQNDDDYFQELKKDLCKKHGMQYYYISSPEDLQSMFLKLRAN